MKAIGYQQSLPVDDPASLEDIELPDPVPGPHDVLVEVRAVSVNPVDTKVRMRASPDAGHAVLGYDAAGIVAAVGGKVSLFAPGDEVWYAGDVTRQGSNAGRQLVDERIVGRKPTTLDFTAAAALPLTTITAWEMLFDSFSLVEGEHAGETLLVIGGAGGVGSILTQLARQLTGLSVVATASRAETTAWCRRMGAHHVIDHRADLAEQLKALDLVPRYVAMLTHSPTHFPAVVELIAPRGEIALIDDASGIDFTTLKNKSLSFHYEFMFTRSMFGTEDMIRQHELLNRVAELVDAGRLESTMNHDGGSITAANLREAHRLQESGSAIGKTVLTGF